MAVLEAAGQAFIVDTQKVYHDGLGIMMEYQKSKVTKAERDVLPGYLKK